MARVLGLKQLLQKNYKFLDNLPGEITESFGKLVENFIMIVWGMSGNGKSNFIMQFLKAIMPHGKVLYVALEEGFEATTQMTALRQLDEAEHGGKIEFADHEMKYEELWKKLEKKKSPRFIVIDSIQYWKITYEQYKRLKERFSKKTFIFISHANGKFPKGKTAEDIMYDAGIKVRIEGYVCTTVISRYGGNRPYVIWEDGAKRYWGKQYKKIISNVQMPKNQEKKSNLTKHNHEEASIHKSEPLVESGELVLGEQSDLFGENEAVLPKLDKKIA